MLRVAKDHEKTRQVVHKKYRYRQLGHGFYHRGRVGDGDEDAPGDISSVCAGYDFC